MRSRERLLGDLIDERETHADAIDASLYAPLSREPGRRNLAEELHGEHRAFMRQLAGLARNRRASATGWLDAFGDATFLVDQHLHRHAHALIPAARESLSRDEARDATRAFIHAKSKALKARRRGTVGGLVTGDLAVAATAFAALGGVAFLAWRAGLFGSLGSSRPYDGREHGLARPRTDLASASTHGPRKKGENLAERQEQLLDEAIEEMFPANDPISPQRFTR